MMKKKLIALNTTPLPKSNKFNPEEDFNPDDFLPEEEPDPGEY